MELSANCKINLGLRVLRKRPDGFHDIETVMFPVRGLSDRVSVLPHSQKTQLITCGIPIDCPAEENICTRALRLMQREFDIAHVRIDLRKAIPTGAGLGGGSSDAAFTLRALNEEFSLRLSENTLEKLAAELGSDAPFFIRNTPQLCMGRGEIMTPVKVDLAGKWLVIIKPDISVSTAEAYAGITPAAYPVPIVEALKRDMGEWRELVKNDFENTIFKKHPVLAQLKSCLYDRGAVYASMSGSGSAIFGIFDKMPTFDIKSATEEFGSVFYHLEQIT